MARATVFQGMQIGVETNPGAAVAANVRLLNTYIDASPATNIKPFRNAGARFNTGQQRGKEHTTAKISGILSYGDLPYLLGSLLCKGTAGTFKPSAFTKDAIDTLTVEMGDANYAERFAYGVVTGLSMQFSKDEATLSGEMIGYPIEEDATLTASPTSAADKAVDMDSVDVLVGTDVASLAKVTRIMSAGVTMTGWRSPFFTLDSGVDSFSDTTEKAPELTSQFVLPHESEAAGYMADLRASTRRILRVKAQEVVGTTTHLLQITCPFTFQGNERGDQDDAYASTFNLAACYDSAFAGAIEVVCTSTTA
jgi:hypothetical protein